MDTNVLSKVEAEASFRAYIQKNVRPDGRDLQAHRGVSLKKEMYSNEPNPEAGTHNYGSSQVHIGNTIVATGVNLMVGQTSDAAPDKGDITCSITLSPMCAVKFDQGRKRDDGASSAKHEDAYRIESILNELLMIGKIVDLTQLCIIPGKCAFRLCVHILCLSHRGNLLDAAIIGAISALKGVKLPEPVFAGGNVSVTRARTKQLEVLSSGRSTQTVVPISLGLFDGQWLVDLEEGEELLMEANLTCVLLMEAQTEPQILYLSQTTTKGPSPVSTEQLRAGLSLCRQTAGKLVPSLM
jgi:exosome complex component RRP43